MKKKIITYVKIILFVLILILVYLVSPKITNTIKNIALYLYEIDENYITRAVELILLGSTLLTIFTNTKNNGLTKSNQKK